MESCVRPVLTRTRYTDHLYLRFLLYLLLGMYFRRFLHRTMMTTHTFGTSYFRHTRKGVASAFNLYSDMRSYQLLYLHDTLLATWTYKQQFSITLGCCRLQPRSDRTFLLTHTYAVSRTLPVASAC